MYYKQLDEYVSWYSTGGTVAVDAFSLKWVLVPRFNIISQKLAKII